MLRIITSTYKELYAWFFYNTNNSLLSFVIAYIITVILQALNICSIILIIQKILGIKLVEFILSEKIALCVAAAALLGVNFLFLGIIWSSTKEIKILNNQAFGYIVVSIVVGAIAFVVGH